MSFYLLYSIKSNDKFLQLNQHVSENLNGKYVIFLSFVNHSNSSVKKFISGIKSLQMFCSILHFSRIYLLNIVEMTINMFYFHY